MIITYIASLAIVHSESEENHRASHCHLTRWHCI